MSCLWRLGNSSPKAWSRPGCRHTSDGINNQREVVLDQTRIIHRRNKKTRDQRTRFFEKVSVHLHGCWLWKGSRSTAGYGTFNLGRRGDGYTYAHIYVYEMLFGPVPKGQELDHLCRVPACCNPWHLEPVSHRLNLIRGSDPRMHAHLHDTCVQGHPRTTENCYTYKGKKYICRVCKREKRRLGLWS